MITFYNLLIIFSMIYFILGGMMKKIILGISIFFLSILTVSANELDLYSKNVILYNLNDNKVLYEQESNEQVSIASITKIMTAIVTIENVEDLSKKVTITKDVYEGMEDYAIVGFKIGSEVSYEELLYGLLLPSGADAGNALAYNVFDSYDKFVTEMNKKAKELKLKNTHFTNAIGADDEDNYSSAKDVASMLKYALKNNKFREIFITKKYEIERFNINMKSTLLTYSARYGVNADYILGAKSGFTDAAGMCLASIATIDDVDYLLVTLGASSKNKANHIKDALRVYDYYSSNYSYQTVIEKGQVLVNLPVKWGKEDKIDIKSDKEEKLYLLNDTNKDKLKYNYKGVEEINKKIKKGDKIGTITVSYDGEKLATYDVKLNKEVEYKPSLLWLILICLVLFIVYRIIKKKIRKKRKYRIK